MCHPEVPPGTPTPSVATAEVNVPLSDGAMMPAFLALPDPTRAPAVLVVTDALGRSPFYENLAMRLALAGFVALTADYFARLTPLADLEAETRRRRRRTESDEVRVLHDLVAALDWLAARPEVTGRPVGVVGFCMGGTLAFDLAADWPRLAASVCYYGYPAGERDRALVPPPTPLSVAHRVRVPVLGHWGDQDPGYVPDEIRELDRRLAGSGAERTLHVYPGLGHGFLAASLEASSGPEYEGACLSWTRTLEFLQRHLSHRDEG